jgi:hypothetical protein
MREITVRIRPLTEEEKKQEANTKKPHTLAVVFVGGEKLCERCTDKMQCLTGLDKCTAYQKDGAVAFGWEFSTFKSIITWVKELCGEL